MFDSNDFVRVLCIFSVQRLTTDLKERASIYLIHTLAICLKIWLFSLDAIISIYPSFCWMTLRNILKIYFFRASRSLLFSVIIRDGFGCPNVEENVCTGSELIEFWISFNNFRRNPSNPKQKLHQTTLQIRLAKKNS
jgi:hypothetical protein